MRISSLLIAMFWLCSSSRMLAQESEAPTYEMSLAQYFNTYGKTPEYVFIIGGVAYRSVEALEKGVSGFRKGSTLEW